MKSLLFQNSTTRIDKNLVDKTERKKINRAINIFYKKVKINPKLKLFFKDIDIKKQRNKFSIIYKICLSDYRRGE